MRVRNFAGKMRDMLCDIKGCDTQVDRLARYLEEPTGWRDWVIQDGDRGLLFEVCGKHTFTKQNPPTLDMMKERIAS